MAARFDGKNGPSDLDILLDTAVAYHSTLGKLHYGLVLSGLL